MSDFLISLRQFVWGMARRFWILLFSLVFNPLRVYDQIIRDYLPPARRFEFPRVSQFFLWVFAGCFTLAAALTYHELRKEREAAEERARRAEEEARGRRITEQALEELSALRSQGIHELFANHVNDETFERSWRPRHEAWKAEVEEHIRANFGPVWADRFRDLGELPGRRYVAGGAYNRRMNMLSKELDIIEEILRSLGRMFVRRDA